MTDIKRRRSVQLGFDAEKRVRAIYESRGFVCLAERFKTKNGEIDLIVLRKGQIAFVEVKARSSLGEAAEAVTPKSQRRIAAAASEYIAQNEASLSHIDTFQFDVACVLPGDQVQIIENAFEALD